MNTSNSASDSEKNQSSSPSAYPEDPKTAGRAFGLHFDRSMHEPAVQRPKRFWTEVSVGEAGALGFDILLDGKKAKTPAGKALALPTRALADLVAKEWAEVGTFVEPAIMPATRLACTAIDRLSETHDDVAMEVARFGGADVLCYFTDHPKALFERQVEHWGPVLDWAEQHLGVKILRTTGIIHRPQPQETLQTFYETARIMDGFQLVAVAHAAGLYTSAILAFAVQRRALSAQTALDLSRLDELYQIEHWGEDEEAKARLAALTQEVRTLEAWFAALSH